MAPGLVDLPDELISQILLNASTPTFIQLTRASKKFYHVARQNREVLLHHLSHLPGDKSKIKDNQHDNAQLFLLLRQRAANSLHGVNFTANLHEHLARGLSINPAASSIGGLDTEYVRMALCFHDSADIRQYTNHCIIKEKIRQFTTPFSRILKLVQWGRFVSVLCAPALMDTGSLSETSSESEASESETEVLNKDTVPPSVNSRLQQTLLQKRRRSDRVIHIIDTYEIIHFDVYAMEDSRIFEVFGLPGLVPRDFAVQDISLCAVLWDRDNSDNRPTDHATICTYTLGNQIHDTIYEQKAVWRRASKQAHSDADSDDEDTPEKPPGSISFFKDGKRIRMYDAGGVVPHRIFATAPGQYDSYAPTNAIQFDNFAVHVDTPFFGTHTTQVDEFNQHSYCIQHHLCLGVATFNRPDSDNSDDVKVLCILRSHTRSYSDQCLHKVELSRMTHVSATNSTVVARLWGWKESCTNLSGKDTVAVSPGGTRIAIAMWDKVLVYPLNPQILCDEVVVDSSDDEMLKSKKKKKKHRKPWEKPCTDYYERKKDKNLLGWKVAELRPIVLDLNGAIAHKMNWSSAKEPITDIQTLRPPHVDEVEEVEDQGTKDEPTSTETEAEQIVGSPSSPGENTPATSEATTSPTQSAVQESAILPPVPESNPVIEETVAETPVSIVETSAQETADEVSPTLEIPEPQIVPSHLQSGQVSPAEPQSPSQPTKQSELAQLSGSSDLHSSTSSTTNTAAPLSHPTLTPYLPNGSPNTSQPSKPPTRKKEKSTESQGSEINLPSHEKKFTDAMSFGFLSKNFNNPNPTAWPLSPSNLTPKPNQTVAEALTINTLSCTANPTEGVSLSNAGTSAAPITTTPAPKVADAASQDQTKVTPPKECKLNENVKSGTSQTPFDEVICQDKSSDDQKKIDTKPMKRKKRISEDELLILTDRGVQIWNLGARAKGKRKKSYLKLEESLRGKLPQWKGKSRAVA